MVKDDRHVLSCRIISGYIWTYTIPRAGIVVIPKKRQQIFVRGWLRIVVNGNGFCVIAKAMIWRINLRASGKSNSSANYTGCRSKQGLGIPKSGHSKRCLLYCCIWHIMIRMTVMYWLRWLRTFSWTFDGNLLHNKMCTGNETYQSNISSGLL